MTRPAEPRWRDLDWSAVGPPLLLLLALVGLLALALMVAGDCRAEGQPVNCAERKTR